MYAVSYINLKDVPFLCITDELIYTAKCEAVWTCISWDDNFLQFLLMSLHRCKKRKVTEIGGVKAENAVVYYVTS